MEWVFSLAVTALISSVTGAAVVALLDAFRRRGRGAVDSSKAMRDGMRSLLWRELKNIHADAMDGGLTVDERRHLESVYGAYHAIGGNGTGTRIYEDAMKTQVKDDG